MAADLPIRAAPPPIIAAPVFSWSGCSVGLLTGYSWSDRNIVRTTGPAVPGIRPATVRVDYDGTTNIGGGIGCDLQFTPGRGVVVGIAADGTWTDLTRRRVVTGPGPAFPESVFRQSLDTLGTIRGRVGYGFDRWLVYATGGFAFGGVEYKADFFSGVRGGSVLTQAGRFDAIETGYVVGGGIEYAIPEDSFLNFFSVARLLGITSTAPTIKLEYLRYDLGSRTIAVAPQLVGAPGYASRFTTEGNLIRGGFTYRFGL
jgi:outer membrane immunogenic protein